MRTIGVISTSRADYGIYLPVLQAIREAEDLRLWMFVSGLHLSPEFGMTVDMIEKDGFDIVERVEMLLSSDSPAGIAKSMGLGTVGFAQAFARSRPDILMALGDRFEMHAGVAAALPFKIPVAHLHGGEATYGAIDESLRHAITKMSHLHFVATDDAAARVRQLGEEPWRITISGAPAIDNARRVRCLSRDEITRRFSIRLEEGYLLVTYHPVTLQYESTEQQVTEVLGALESCGRPVVITMSNADTQGRSINQRFRKFVAEHARAQMVDNLGTQGYFSLMTHAAAMVGNSSSGIIEAASFRLPVINIGPRQQGRLAAGNVIHVACQQEAILRGISQATSEEFRNSLRDLINPYGDGEAAGRIVQRLRTVPLGEELIRKRFYNLRQDGSEKAEAHP